MKSLKSKLMAAGAMLMVSVVMLTSASFAWFTVSTAPETSNVKVEMSATQNLEIAGGTAEIPEVAPGQVNMNTWGSKVVFGSSAVSLTQMAKVTGTLIETIESYGTDGRPNALVTATEKTAANYADTTATPQVLGSDAGNCAVVYDLQLRSNYLTSVKATLTETKNDGLDVYLVTGTGGSATATKLTAGTPVTVNLDGKNDATPVKMVVCMDGTTKTAANVETKNEFEGKLAFAAPGA